MVGILRKYKISVYKIQFIVFLISIVVGAMFANKLTISRIEEYKLLSGYFVTKFPDSAYLNIELFKYVIWARVKLIIGIWLFGFTFFELIINYLVIIYFGFSMGYQFSIGLISNGFNGYFLFFALSFPHYLIYIPMFIYLIVKSTNFSTTLYSNRARSRSLNISKQMIIEYVLVLIICLIFMTIGSILETYINPQIVKWYISVINM